MFQIS